jgi:luciferase family oxidoreductase group 1
MRIMPDFSDVRWSVLDLVPVSTATTPAQALRASVDLAPVIERLGYHRLWVAEHHGMPGIASSAPAVLIAHLAEATTTLRVGSGGVMLPNHAPLVVAEQFGTLAALHPDRIDLGIGRAPGTDQATAYALRRSPDLSADAFPEDLSQLRAFLDGTYPRIRAVPAPERPPQVWLLGSSGYSAQLAGVLGLPFAFAHHFSARFTDPALELYRSSFQPAGALEAPYAMVTAAVFAADTDEEARRLAAPQGLSILRLRSGRPGPLATPEEALAYDYSPQEREAIESFTESHIVGGPDTVRKGLQALLERTRPQELMVSTNIGDPAARRRSYEIVAELAADL